MANVGKYQDLIRHFVIENLARERGITSPISDEDSLIEQGIVDSMGIVQLVGHLERTLSIKIPDEDIIPENFDSIVSLAAYIDRMR